LNKKERLTPEHVAGTER